MKRIMVYSISDNGDLNSVITGNLEDITGIIEGTLCGMSAKEKKEVQFTIDIKFMTEKQIDNLPEWEG